MLPRMLARFRRTSLHAQRFPACPIPQVVHFSPVRCAAAVTASPAVAAQDAPCRLAGAEEPLARALRQADRWIVFSDLHVHQKYEPHWQRALQDVHSLAQERGAGILFLVQTPPLCGLSRALRAGRGSACTLWDPCNWPPGGSDYTKHRYTVPVAIL